MAPRRGSKERRRGEGWTAIRRVLSDGLPPAAWLFLRRAGLLTLVAAATWGSLEIRRQIHADGRFRLETWRIEFGSFPDWVTPDIQAEIERVHDSAVIGADFSGATVFRQGLLADIRAELLENPWILAVPSLRLDYPGIDAEGQAVAGGLTAEILLRRPIAAVRWGGEHYLTDEENRRLGGPRTGPPGNALDLPVIVGTEDLASGALPAAGERWQVNAVEEGLAVAREIHRAGFGWRYPGRPIEEIDVRNVGGRRNPLMAEIVLRARGLPVLEWGRSPISRGARVLPVREILANLEQVLGSPPGRFARVPVIRLYTDPMVGISLEKS